VQAKTLIKTLVGRWTHDRICKSLGLKPIAKTNGKLRKQNRYMPQTPALSMTSAKRNILFFGAAQNVPDLEKNAMIFAFAELTSRANDLVRTFSGGMKKRVSLWLCTCPSTKNCLFRWADRSYWPHLKLQSWTCSGNLLKQEYNLFISTHLMMEALLCDKVLSLERRNYCVWHASENTGKRQNNIEISENSENKTSIIDSTPEACKRITQMGLSKLLHPFLYTLITWEYCFILLEKKKTQSQLMNTLIIARRILKQLQADKNILPFPLLPLYYYLFPKTSI